MGKPLDLFVTDPNSRSAPRATGGRRTPKRPRPPRSAAGPERALHAARDLDQVLVMMARGADRRPRADLPITSTGDGRGDPLPSGPLGDLRHPERAHRLARRHINAFQTTSACQNGSESAGNRGESRSCAAQAPTLLVPRRNPPDHRLPDRRDRDVRARLHLENMRRASRRSRPRQTTRRPSPRGAGQRKSASPGGARRLLPAITRRQSHLLLTKALQPWLVGERTLAWCSRPEAGQYPPEEALGPCKRCSGSRPRAVPRCGLRLRRARRLTTTVLTGSAVAEIAPLVALAVVIVIAYGPAAWPRSLRAS